MSEERIIGVDFGTSTSVIRVKRYDENGKAIGDRLATEKVLFNGKDDVVPTLIRKKNADHNVAYYGYEAELGKRGHTLYQGFKVDLESPDPEKKAQARALTAEFYAWMGKQYRAQSDGGFFGPPTDCERTIISYPVKWSDETKRFLMETAAESGFPNVEGVDEAQAAVHAVLVQNEAHLKKIGLFHNGEPTTILLVDMGAGTTDLVLCRYTPGIGSMEPLNTWPQGDKAMFGGQEVDILLQDFFRSMLTQEDADALFRRVGTDKFKEWKDKMVSPTLQHNEVVNSFEALDHCLELMKVDLEEYELDREAFEQCLANYLPQLPTLIRDCIQHSSVGEEDIDLVIVTGGHSQWYFVRDILLGNMTQYGALDLVKIKAQPERFIALARPQETVALGLIYMPERADLPEPIIEDTDALIKKAMESIEQGDGEEALALTRKAAEQGNAEAQFMLGRLYDEGIGVEKDVVQAAKWIRKAAEGGDADAQCFLGICYVQGEGVTKNEVEAVKWFRKAAEQEHAPAQCALGFCYEEGTGVEADCVQAEKWYQKAAEQGVDDAKQRLANLNNRKKTLSSEEEKATIIVERKKRYLSWKRAYVLYLDGNRYYIENGGYLKLNVSTNTEHSVGMGIKNLFGNGDDINSDHIGTFHFKAGEVMKFEINGTTIDFHYQGQYIRLSK